MEATDAATDTERKVGAIFAEAFGADSLDADADFFELGGDSLLAVGMLLRIEEVLGKSLPLDVLSEHPTIRAIAAYLEAPEPAPKSTNIITVQSGTSAPLFCLPGIGGTVLEFQSLKKRLPPSQTIYALPSEGAEDGNTTHTTIEAMAAHAVARMRAMQPTGPYYLLGYSIGGIVAFESARQLRAAGQEVALLAMLDSSLWSPAIELSLLNKARLHTDIIVKSNAVMRRRYLDDRLRVLKARLRRFDLKRKEEDFFHTVALTPASRRIAEQHAHALRDYRPAVYDRPILLFRVSRDPRLATRVNEADPTLGWAQWTTQGVTVHDVNATHMMMLRIDELSVLADYLPRVGENSNVHA